MHKASESDLGRGCPDCLLCLNPRRSGGSPPKQIHSIIWNTPQIGLVYGAETIRPSRKFESQVLEVMYDQAARGQIIVMTEVEAKLRFPDLVIAWLGAQRKEKPGGKVSARVLFDGTHGLCVNTKTRLRDQERAPIAADLKRSMREKAKVGELTFALSRKRHRSAPPGSYTSR